MTFEQFKTKLIAEYGPNVKFTEVGKHGWTSIDDILDRKPGGNPGPHWCDASKIPEDQWLLGNYNFNTGTAIFFVWDHAIGKMVEHSE